MHSDQQRKVMLRIQSRQSGTIAERKLSASYTAHATVSQSAKGLYTTIYTRILNYDADAEGAKPARGSASSSVASSVGDSSK